MKYSLFAFIPILIVFIESCSAQQVNTASVMFYNLENLYDTINDPQKDDEVFLPTADRKWNTEKYEKKLDQLAKVISANGLPTFVGLSEVENKNVVQDLILTDALEAANYGIVHFDSPDERGIDVALLYDKDVFAVENSKPIHVTLPGDSIDYTRDILYVSGQLKIGNKKEQLHLFINHWPSRVEGEEVSAPKRAAAAQTLKHAVDSLFNKFENPDIIIMGDFNDTPYDKSISQVLGALDHYDAANSESLVDLMAEKQKNGEGSYNYKGNWQALDQLIVSSSLLNNKKFDVDLHSVGFIRKDWMLFHHEKYGDSPDRTYIGTKYIGGYSDHLPIYMQLIFL